MIKYEDSLGIERAIEFSLSFDRKYINLTLWTAKNSNGSTIQIPLTLKQELINNLEKINVTE